jgi:hypothetical protein
VATGGAAYSGVPGSAAAAEGTCRDSEACADSRAVPPEAAEASMPGCCAAANKLGLAEGVEDLLDSADGLGSVVVEEAGYLPTSAENRIGMMRSRRLKTMCLVTDMMPLWPSAARRVSTAGLGRAPGKDGGLRGSDVARAGKAEGHEDW